MTIGTDSPSGRLWRHILGANIHKVPGYSRYVKCALIQLYDTKEKSNFFAGLRWDSILNSREQDSWRSGRWCCTVLKKHRTERWHPHHPIQSWLSSKKLMRIARCKHDVLIPRVLRWHSRLSLPAQTTNEYASFYYLMREYYFGQCIIRFKCYQDRSIKTAVQYFPAKQ